MIIGTCGYVSNFRRCITEGHHAFCDWLRLYSLREQDLIMLLETCLPQISAHASDASNTFAIDIHEPISHGKIMYPGMAGCFLRTHRFYMPKHKRHMFGIEHMFALGFPKTLCRTGINDIGLRSIGGNSMSVHFLARLMLTTLLLVDFESPVEQLLPFVKKMRSTVSAHLSVTLKPHWGSSPDSMAKVWLPGLGPKKRNSLANAIAPLDVQSHLLGLPSGTQNLGMVRIKAVFRDLLISLLECDGQRQKAPF